MIEFLEAIVWGLVQGLTEFLPISSSGHLVIVPGFLGMDAPSLETAAFLHLGTLAAVIVFYWTDLRWLLKFRSDAVARKVIGLLALGSVPAAAGFFLRDTIAALFESNKAVGAALVFTGLILWASGLIERRDGDVESSRFTQALMIGVAQAAALVPGISRSGMTITAGIGVGLSRTEAARFSFLLGIPAIFAAGAVEGTEALQSGGVNVATMVGVVVAGLSGYTAIKLLLRVLTKVGLRPFSYYCLGVGAAVLVLL